MRLSKFRPNKETNLELSNTSMIDVVFLLLIFFLVTTTFAASERQLKPNIRTEDKSTASIEIDIEPAYVDIVRENGMAVYRFGTTVTSNIDVIEEVLNQYPDKTAGAFVRLSDNCPFGMAANAIHCCKKAGFTSVSLLPR